MKIRMMLLAAALLWPTMSYAENAEVYYAEIKQWVVEPCAEVGAALAVDTIGETDMTSLRALAAQALIRKQESAARTMAALVRPGSPWELRRKGYKIMLKMCIERMPSWPR